jgi:DNA-binding CsgD family transcriptional regulator/tetratricopeptide (TPR) repeat protein
MADESGRRTAAPVADAAAAHGTEPIGRGRECRLLDALLDAVTRRGAALMLWGDPGVGKTTLLDYVADRVEVPVLRARGVESEAMLPYATLADLLVPLRRHFREIPAVQRQSLEASLALVDSETPNPYAVCAAALNVVAAAAETEPVVLLVDDLHWVDQSSQRVLLFIARRLASERVALVLTGRDDADLRSRCDLPATDVTGLSRAECAELLRRHGLATAPGIGDDLADRTGGNPLALLEWAGSLRPAQLAGDEPIGHLLPLGRQLEHAWLLRIERLPDRTRAALAVLGAGGSPAVGVLESALAALGFRLADLAPAEAAGIVVTGGGKYEFRHPLLRSAVQRQTSLADRLAAFRALAGVTSGTTRAWFRASAATEPDESVAGELIEAAREARRRSGYDAAALAWHRAAELTPFPEARGELLGNAAADAFLGGASLRALAWCDEALTAVPDPAQRADVEQLRGRIRTWIGQTTAAHDGLVAAAESVRERDPGRASALLGESVLPAVMDGHVALAVRRAEESVALAAEAGIRAPCSSVLYGLILTIDGRIAEALDRLDREAGFLAAADPVAYQQLLTLTAQSLGHAERPGPARRTITLVIDAARRHAAPAVLPMALGVRSEIEYWAGRWAAAEADATESLRWAEELGQPSALGYSLVCLARLDAVRGDRARCEDRVARGRRDVGPYAVGCLDTYFTEILGESELAYGEYDCAAAHLRQTFETVTRHGMGNPRIVPFAANLVEAHVRAGHPERAVEPLEWLRHAAARTGLTWPAAVLARCRGLLASTLDEAEAGFAEAEQWHRRHDHPFERARTQLCRGEALRRLRRPAAARAPLIAAHACFESLGAAPWARRSAAELAAAGQRGIPDTAPATLDQLSPQEVQVARAIARGMNNAEAAGALFVSRKTVEAHLTRVYRKLGVRSRTDLTRAVVSAGLAD